MKTITIEKTVYTIEELQGMFPEGYDKAHQDYCEMMATMPTDVIYGDDDFYMESVNDTCTLKYSAYIKCTRNDYHYFTSIDFTRRFFLYVISSAMRRHSKGNTSVGSAEIMQLLETFCFNRVAMAEWLLEVVSYRYYNGKIESCDIDGAYLPYTFTSNAVSDGELYPFLTTHNRCGYDRVGELETYITNIAEDDIASMAYKLSTMLENAREHATSYDAFEKDARLNEYTFDAHGNICMEN